jgi:hypothetical protein
VRLLSGPALKAILAGIAGGLLAAAGYLLIWALWYAIVQNPYSGYAVDSRALQEGVFMLLLVPAVTAFFALTAETRAIETLKDALTVGVISGLTAGATLFVAAAAGLFRLFFGIVPGPYQCDSVMFCSATGYDGMINDPLPLFYFGPHGGDLSPLQGVLSIAFDVATDAIRFLFIPAVMTALCAAGIFYLLPFLLHVFEDPNERNGEKMLVTIAIGLLILAVISLPPMLFAHK